MITRLKGIASFLDERSILIDVVGVGYKVFVTEDLKKQYSLNSQGKSKEIEVWTYLAVRENALDLYGFENRETLGFFELLITVSGIGPKTALNILNLAPIKIIQRAVSEGDVSHLTKVSGIGKKNAEKIVIELKDKVDLDYREQSDLQSDVDALEALKSLGYSLNESRDALKKVSSDSKDMSEKIKQALKFLGR